MAKRILICDDDEGILDMLTTLLECYGFGIIAEKNSLNVPAIIEQQKPDVILLDLWMPVLSGDQLLKGIRSNPATRRLPVIIISASTEGKTIALSAGATDYISKPFNIESIIEKIEAAVN